MDESAKIQLRSIPKMDELLALPWVSELEEEIGHDAVKNALTEAIDSVRKSIRDGQFGREDVRGAVIDAAHELIDKRASASLRRVINATGVVVHTNLGRSPIPRSAVDAICDVSIGYSTLEYSLEAGARGQRNSHVEWMIKELTGAEGALVVNNNAAAVLLALAAIAKGREVIVSAGELVEIGGSFRIPDILAFGGSKMVMVGCTNRTHLRDYRDAITEDTAVLLKVHPSNYRVMGFTEEVPREELAALAHERGLIFMEDLGSGLLEPLGIPGVPDEATVRQCIESGVDIVTFSGDKLLGGPQMGILVGREDLIGKMRRNQFLRAVRVDKMTLAAFDAVLREYMRGQSSAIPTIGMLRLTEDDLRSRAEKLAESLRLSTASIPSAKIEIVRVEDAVGGGSYPTTALPGWGVAVSIAGGISSGKLAERLRRASLPVVAGVRDDAVVLHVRTLLGDDEDSLPKIFKEIFRVD